MKAKNNPRLWVALTDVKKANPSIYLSTKIINKAGGLPNMSNFVSLKKPSTKPASGKTSGITVGTSGGGMTGGKPPKASPPPTPHVRNILSNVPNKSMEDKEEEEKDKK